MGLGLIFSHFSLNIHFYMIRLNDTLKCLRLKPKINLKALLKYVLITSKFKKKKFTRYIGHVVKLK